MDGAENKPMIRIHLDQQVNIDAVSGHEEVEDATVITEITGFDVEDDLYVLRGALSFSGFLRMEDASDTGAELPDPFDDRDIFATEEEVAEAPVMPFHHSLPFVLQVPVAAQQAHQRENGVLNVNPKIGQWNVHVLGEQTVHLRAELVIQGLSGQEGYVFRCGSQEEGAVASKLDQLLDQEESRSFIPPVPQLEGEAFEPPFEPAWQVEEGANLAGMRQEFEGVEADESSEDDWLIESPVQETEEADPREDDEDTEILFTPDPDIVFPMPDPDSDWARQLEAADQAFHGQTPFVTPFAGAKDFTQAYEPLQETHEAFARAQEFSPEQYVQEHFAHESFVPQAQEAVESAFELEAREDQPYLEEPLPAFRADDVDADEEAAEAFAEAEADDEEDAFAFEPERTEEETAEQADDADASEAEVIEAVAPVDDAPAVEAEYHFEDEVQAEEVQPAVAPVEAVEIPFAKPTGPKLSVSSKEVKMQTDEPIKLSALLGDSRSQVVPAPQAAEALAESAYVESGSLYASAQLIRESLTYAESASQAAQASAEDAAPVHTSQQGHHSDSIWGDLLFGGRETKATMKFRIVQGDESLPDLAEAYNTPLNDLLRANNLSQNHVDAGQILYIPQRRR